MNELYRINYDHDIEEFYISHISVNKDKNQYKQKHTLIQIISLMFRFPYTLY